MIVVLNENELRQVIIAAAQKNTDRNLIVLLRTDTFAINANMMTSTNIGCISVIDRRNMASNLPQEDVAKLHVRLEFSIGCYSGDMKDLLASVVYIFDDEWYMCQSSEISPNCMKAPKQDYHNLSALFNYALNNLWFDKDRKRFEEIDTNNMLPSDRLIYDNIKCYLPHFSLIIQKRRVFEDEY